MTEFNTNYIIMKNQAIYVIVAIYQYSTDKPLFYNIGHIATIMKSSANLIKKINREIPNNMIFTIKIICCRDNITDAQAIYDNLKIIAPAVIDIGNIPIEVIEPQDVKSVGRPATAAIRCIETGETWPSASITARALGVSAARMSQHLSGRCGKIAGRTYERI